MQTSSGEQWRLAARWNTILDKIGAIESGAVTPLIARILGDTDVQKLSDFFNTGVDAAERMGKDFGSVYDKLSKTGQLSETSRLLGDIASQFGQAFGFKGQNTVETLTDAYKNMNGALKWVDEHFQSIANWSKIAFGSMLAINGIKFAAGFVGAVNTLATAFFGLRDAAVAAEAAEKAAWLARLGPAGLLLGAGVLGAHTIDKGADRKNAPAVMDAIRKQFSAHPGAPNLGAPHRSDFPDMESYKNAIQRWREQLERSTNATDSSAISMDRLNAAANATSNSLSFLSSRMGSFPIGSGSSLSTSIPRGTKIDASEKPSRPTASITIHQTINVAGADIDHSRVRATLKGHAEDLSDTLRKALAEDARLSYA